MGDSGTIPFMAMPDEKFPGTQFVVTDVLGAHSNAHDSNELLCIPMAKAERVHRGCAERSRGTLGEKALGWIANLPVTTACGTMHNWGMR